MHTTCFELQNKQQKLQLQVSNLLSASMMSREIERVGLCIKLLSVRTMYIPVKGQCQTSVPVVVSAKKLSVSQPSPTTDNPAEPQ